MFLIIWGTIELVSLLVIIFKYGSWEMHLKGLRVAAVLVPDRPGGIIYPRSKMIHPYIGVVRQPHLPSVGLTIAGQYRVTEYGFVDVDSPIQKRAPDRLIVGIMGGSVARQFACNATDLLEEELLKCPEFSGRKCHFVRLGIDGCKQPQQLMIVNHLLSQGAEFDLIVSLDGLNEIALPDHDNLPYGINSAYPVDWGMLTQKYVGDDYVELLGHSTHIRRQQQNLARWALSFPQVYSPIVQVLCGNEHDRLVDELTVCFQQLSRLNDRRKVYAALGPPESFESTDALHEHCVEIWYRSSVLLHRVCLANNIRYFHFLQPNQYLPGSKPMGPQEVAAAIEVDSRTGAAVKACYPRMQAKGPSFHEAGVAFTDLTGVFSEVTKPVYNDGCCHMEKVGDLIMAKAIGLRICQLIAASHANPRAGGNDAP